MFYDAEGRVITSLEYHLKQDYQKAAKEEEHPEEVNILNEDEVDTHDSKHEKRYLKKVKKTLKEHAEADT